MPKCVISPEQLNIIDTLLSKMRTGIGQRTELGLVALGELRATVLTVFPNNSAPEVFERDLNEAGFVFLRIPFCAGTHTVVRYAVAMTTHEAKGMFRAYVRRMMRNDSAAFYAFRKSFMRLSRTAVLYGEEPHNEPWKRPADLIGFPIDFRIPENMPAAFLIQYRWKNSIKCNLPLLSDRIRAWLED